MLLPVLTPKNRKDLRQETLATVAGLVHELGQVMDLLPASFYHFVGHRCSLGTLHI